MKTTVKNLFHVALCVIAVVYVVSAQSSAGRPITTRDLAGVNDPYGVQISPDGKWVTYRVIRYHVDWNERPLDEFWLVQTTGFDKPRQLPSWPSHAWSPDSKTIAFVTPKFDEIRLLRVADMTETVLTKKGDWKEGFEDLELGTFGSLQWSPDGKSIAFLTDTKKKGAAPQDAQKAEAWRAVEMDVEPFVPVGERPASVLCVTDVTSGGVRRVTDRSLGIRGWGGPFVPWFTWSPNSTQLVFTAAEVDPPRRSFNGAETGLYVVDMATAKLKTLFKNMNEQAQGPIWSPDGKWIAYRHAELWAANDGKIAVISPDGGEPRLITQNDNDIYNAAPDFWSRDSKEVYFSVPYKLSYSYFRVSLEGKITKVTPDDGNYDSFSLSEKGDTLAFVYQNVTEPQEIYVASSSLSNGRKLTDLNPQLKGIAMPNFQTVKWRSEDDKWDIHGILVKPVGYVEGKKYPLVVCIKGGPGPTTHSFGIDSRMAVLALAARGYLVLCPNPRGRPGFGRDFRSAPETDGSFYAIPLGDITSGVDELVRRGIVDPDRVGWMGFSWGANQIAYGLTRTDRFKAAWLGDPPHVDEGLLFLMMNDSAKPKARGIPVPLTVEQIERKLREAPIYHMYNVKTPAILECGGKSPTMDPTMARSISSTCIIYFQQLRSYQVPSELHVFKDEGHGWSKPLQWEESFNRQLEWLDYWVRGIATERMAKRYGPPKNAENVAGVTSK